MVFFLLLESLLILLFLQLYHNSRDDFNRELLHNMQVCSYSLSCNKFTVDFSPQKQHELNQLYLTSTGVDAYFYIPKSKKFDMRLHQNQTKYTQNLNQIKKQLMYQWILLSFGLIMVALFFTFYSLKPIRKALQLNDEFVKDILHDFNTPIASMVLNISMFNHAQGQNPYITKVSQSLETILLLENNLKTFLHNSPKQTSIVNIGKLAKDRLDFVASIYSRLEFDYQEKNALILTSNNELLCRIIDNLLSNACKYNKPRGKVSVTIVKNQVIIEDTGKGIKDVKKVLNRYYKEQERGLGLGLHIVQKLTKELNIALDITSEIKIGTKIILTFL